MTEYSKGIGKQRRASRLGAIQSLYASHVGALDIAIVKQDFLAGGGCVAFLSETEMKSDNDFDAEADHTPVRNHVGAEKALYLDIINGVDQRIDELAAIVGQALNNRRLQDCEVVLQKIFLCGTYELVVRVDIDPKLTIAEYVSITDAFFGGREPQLVNGTLNAIAQSVRDSFV